MPCMAELTIPILALKYIPKSLKNLLRQTFHCYNLHSQIVIVLHILKKSVVSTYASVEVY